MNEREALSLLAGELEAVGDDAAVIGELVITTDMLHEQTDFPEGTTSYTAGWRAVGASLSDVAAMGADPTAVVAAYAAPTFDREELAAFVQGATDVCSLVDAAYVGGDLDTHVEFTVTTTAIGQTDAPVHRDGARPGDCICVTGTLGRSAAALTYFTRDNPAVARANDLFQFTPRIDAGRTLRPYATAMMDSSDGLSRSLHQLAEASDCGVAIESATIPVDDAVTACIPDETAALERAITFGEDFELVAAIPESDLEAAKAAVDVPLTVVGTVVGKDAGLTIDGETLPDRGYTHGD